MKIQISSRTLLACVSVSAVSVYVCLVQQPWRDERFRTLASISFKRHANEIKKKLEIPDNPAEWGIYCAVDEKGHRLLQLADGNWIMTGDSYRSSRTFPEQNFGTYELIGTWLHLTPKYDDSFVPKRLRLLNWSGRRYLLRPEEIDSFEIAYKAGAEPRDAPEGDFLLRLFDYKLGVSGPPGLLSDSETRGTTD